MKETTVYSNNDFESLVERIQSASEILQQDARAIINRNVTCRAWVTGYYIVEYEQNGNDRAKYGEQLLSNLSKRLGEKSFGISSLKNYRKFYLLYPELNSTISGYLTDRFANNKQIIKALQLPQKKAKHCLAFSTTQKAKHCLAFSTTQKAKHCLAFSKAPKKVRHCLTNWRFLRMDLQ